VHQLAQLSLKNRALIALVTVVTAVFGTISFGSLKQELIPSLEIPALAVITSYPGASPEVVAQDVTGPLEQALQTVPGLQGTSGTSSTGVSLVLAEFEYGTEVAGVEQKMNQAIGRVRSFLPEDVDPTVLAISLDDFPILQIAVSAEDTEALAGRLDDIVVPAIERLDGVAAANVAGAAGPRVEITPDDAALARLGLSRAQVAPLLLANGTVMSGGLLEDDGQSLAVQLGTRLASVEDVAALPLLTEQGPVALSEVAEVELGTEPLTSYSLVDGVRSLTLSVTKLPDANTVEVSEAVRDLLPGLQAQLDGAQLDVLIDQAPFITESISSLALEGGLGLVFAVIVILLFLRSARATLVTAISIPLSILVAFVGMNAVGYTLNILTLGGLTIAIGRIVDDSIVVIENVERHLEYGKSRTRTIVDAVREVASAITASTVTTVVVFLPVALVGGLAGELFSPFAFTVAIAMGASLLVALTIVPVLAYWWLVRRRPAETRPAPTTPAERLAELRETSAQDTALLQRGYRRTIDWVLHHRWVTLGIAAAVLVGTGAMAPLLKTNFLGDMSQGTVGVTQQVAPGTSLEAQLETAEEVSRALSGVEGVELVQATLGTNEMSVIFGGGSESITYSVVLAEDADAAAATEGVREALTGLVPEDEVSVSAVGGAGFSNDVEIIVTGPEQAAIDEATRTIGETMAALPESVQVSTSLTEARPTLQVTIDREAAAAVGFTETQLSQLLAGAMTPQQIGQVTIDETNVGVFLTPVDPPGSVEALRTLPVLTARGVLPLGELAEVEIVDGPVAVSTIDTRRNASVSVTPASDDIGQASLAVRTALDGLTLPDGVQAEIGGITAEQDEAFGQLFLAILAAILIVYVVMVATFRSLLHPFLLLVSIPFAATGSILLQVATGIPLGVASLIGVLMLVGIVVTNAIVLIDLVKQYREAGLGMDEALRLGATRRVRPVIMTALAAILAMTPMAIGVTGHSGFISQPLALVVVGGLFSSTLMTLVVLPTIYHLVETPRERRALRRAGAEARALERLASDESAAVSDS